MFANVKVLWFGWASEDFWDVFLNSTHIEEILVNDKILWE